MPPPTLMSPLLSCTTTPLQAIIFVNLSMILMMTINIGVDGAPERRLDGGVAVEEVVGPGHGRYPRLELVRGQLVAVVDVDQVPHLPEHGILFQWLLHFDIDNGSPLDQDHISYIDLCGQAEAILGGDNSTNS